ncbi:MAG TPA: hypothetical protein VM261_23720 [Kofleriaceae bacterium]|nr:hypothetical protein [Kofleriaceae bacterium]
MMRLVWYLAVMGLWSVATLVPAKALRRKEHRTAAGALTLVGLAGIALLTALLFTAYVKGWRAPYEGFKRT